MPSATQQHRHLAIETPLGADKLLLKSVSIQEKLGALFQIDTELVSGDPKIDFDRLVGHNVTIRVELIKTGSTRYFNGFVSRFTQTQADPHGASYRATIVPWLWFLTRHADCRIFQNRTIPDIIKQVFRDHGFTDFQDKLSGQHTPWIYCVQYRETDFNFVSRLMEQEGIYYFFQHENGKHTLILADSESAHLDYPGYESIRFRPEAHGNQSDETISHWTLDQQVQPGTYALNDFNFEKPRTPLLSKSETARQHGYPKSEIYDYPGEYEEKGHGEDYAKIRNQELQAQFEVAHGQTNARGISAGFTFSLKEHVRIDQRRKYLITSASIHLTGDSYEGGSQGGAMGEFFSGSFTAIDAHTHYRAPRITPKPLIQGPQTALVVGPAGEEIHTDKYGRVKVQFHWDRYGKADENSSCWVRLSQNGWAGKKWGAMSIPRIGHEVIIEFLEGDPDLPIITGSVYNADAMPPYDLPAEKTKSTLKSNSSKGSNGFNEIRFEDKKGSEQLFLHAEKNHDLRVKNVSKTWIGKDKHLIVAHDQFEEVKGDKHLTVKGDQNEKITGTLSQTIAADFQQKITAQHAIDAGQDIHLKAGANVVIEAGASITLKVGGSFVHIGPSGVAIKGPTVLVNSGGSPGAGAGSTPDLAKLPAEADKAKPGNEGRPTRSPASKTPTNPKAIVLHQAAKNGTPFCEVCEAAKKGTK